MLGASRIETADSLVAQNYPAEDSAETDRKSVGGDSLLVLAIYLD